MTQCHPQDGTTDPQNDYAITEAQKWFANHVKLEGKPYTLDRDQARAAIDFHKNTLVTARAGSGKTRVIVAKVAYLVAQRNLSLDEIAIFMFNRTAAAEVNQRIANVEIDGRKLTATDAPVRVASTFHKYALDIVKLSGQSPQIITGDEHELAIQHALNQALAKINHHASPNEHRELLSIVSGFVARAGQQFPGTTGLEKLMEIVKTYCMTAQDKKYAFYHQISLETYLAYLKHITPRIDFNLLMFSATAILAKADNKSTIFSQIHRIKYIMIDEYQDFSYLFYSLTQAIRQLAPNAHLFAVGDDWQAINRFAGSDCDYFLNFANYFPEDTVNIPLATNYRSAKGIVMRANQFMLKNYDPQAIPAQAFSRERGKIKFLNPTKLKFDHTDIKEDGLQDGRFQNALVQAALDAEVTASTIPTSAAQLLKQLVRIIKRHRRSQIMLLHRHNFTSFEGVSLEILHQALRNILLSEYIMSLNELDKQIRCMTMHKSKGLESEVVILLEVDREVVQSSHPHAAIFQLFGDTRAAEVADQQRLLYVAMTRAKKYLYVLTKEKPPLI